MMVKVVRTCSAILTALLAVGCAYHNPDAPSTVTAISASVPFSLTLGATMGSGVDAGRATVTAKVQNVNGTGLSGVTVQFTTDVGTLSAASVVTGVDGTATTTITAANSAGITATAGSLTTHTLVASQPTVATPPPLPPSNPIPDPLPVGPLSVTLNATEVTVGTQTIFSANVKNGPAVSFVWAFGDGASFTGSSGTTAHTFGGSGTALASVTVTDALGRTASATAPVTVNAVPQPLPTPIPLPALTANLTANAASVPVGGALVFTLGVDNLNVGETLTAFQWDLDGNGTFEITSTSNVRTSNPYPTAGLFTAKAVATTSSGRTATGTVRVVVTN